MLLKVGQLAQQTGLTVRTLHHYDSIGLLTPSARTDAGYRLYNRNDITRLHQIQALKRMGLDLAGIGALLSSSDLSFGDIVERQIDMLEQQINQATTLRGRLLQLRRQLSNGDEPALADLLTTMELMTMYDQYFTPDELKQLPFAHGDNTAIRAEWAALVAEVQALMTAGATPADPSAHALAARWMTMLQRDTNHDPRLFAKLNRMHASEPALQQQTGISPELMGFVLRASSEAKYAIFANYLNAAELAFLRANYESNTQKWPPLVAEIKQQMALGTPAGAPAMQTLAARWMALFTSYAGHDAGTHAKIRLALANEPGLRSGFLNEEMLAYVRQAVTLLPQR